MTLDGATVVPVLHALADPTRLRAVELLSRGPRRAGDLAGELGVSAPVMSKHLRVLLRAGLIGDERPAHDARVRVFHLQRESVVAVGAWLDQIQAHWDEQLGSFKAHVERRSRNEPARRRGTVGDVRGGGAGRS